MRNNRAGPILKRAKGGKRFGFKFIRLTSIWDGYFVGQLVVPPTTRDDMVDPRQSKNAPTRSAWGPQTETKIYTREILRSKLLMSFLRHR